MTVEVPNAQLLQEVASAWPTLWVNPKYKAGAIDGGDLPVNPSDVLDAKRNWERLAPLLAACFEELEATGGVIRSELLELKALRHALEYGSPEYGRLFMKADSELPVAGSIKARGGVYEVFLFAEDWRGKMACWPTGRHPQTRRGRSARLLFWIHDRRRQYRQPWLERGHRRPGAGLQGNRSHVLRCEAVEGGSPASPRCRGYQT